MCLQPFFFIEALEHDVNNTHRQLSIIVRQPWRSEWLRRLQYVSVAAFHRNISCNIYVYFCVFVSPALGLPYEYIWLIDLLDVMTDSVLQVADHFCVILLPDESFSFENTALLAESCT